MTNGTKKSMPKGGRKGGTTFPRVKLEEAVGYAKKLVAKTHTGPQPAQIVLPGVFGNAGPEGGVRASALKQFGLLKGTPAAYQATDLAKEIAPVAKGEAIDQIRKACLKPKLFLTLYNTFKSDSVTISKIRQQAANHKVHPESLDECVSVFLDSAVYAELAQVAEDTATFTACEPVIDKNDATRAAGSDDGFSGDDGSSAANLPDGGGALANVQMRRAEVEIKIDPSMDPEKLEKLLLVLKKYGQI